MVYNLLHEYETANWTLTNSSAGLVYHQISPTEYIGNVKNKQKKSGYNFERRLDLKRVNQIAINTSIGLAIAGSALLCISIFPNMLTRVACFVFGLAIMMYAMFVKSQEYEVPPGTAPT